MLSLEQSITFHFFTEYLPLRWVYSFIYNKWHGNRQKWCWASSQFGWSHNSIMKRIFCCLVFKVSKLEPLSGMYVIMITWHLRIVLSFPGIGNIYFVAQIMKSETFFGAGRDILKISSHHHELPVIKCWKSTNINWQVQTLTSGKAFIYCI